MSDLSHMTREILEAVYPNAYELLMPDPEYWFVADGSAGAGIFVFDDTELIQVSSAIVMDVPRSSDLYAYVAHEGRSMTLGRFYVAGGWDDASCTVLAEECIPGFVLNQAYPPSLRYYHTVIATMLGRAGDTGADILRSYGGRPFNPATDKMVPYLASNPAP
jgi:hypothetical protein